MDVYWCTVRYEKRLFRHHIPILLTFKFSVRSYHLQGAISFMHHISRLVWHVAITSSQHHNNHALFYCHVWSVKSQRQLLFLLSVSRSRKRKAHHDKKFNSNNHGTFYQHGFTEIRAWMSNHIFCFMRDAIAHKCPNFNRCWSYGKDGYLRPTKDNMCHYLSLP